jgi:hypothetical protein
MLIRSNVGLDFLGTCASFGCMLHCFAVPLLAAILPLLGGAERQKESSAEGVTLERLDVEPASKSHETCSDSCCASPSESWTHVGLLVAVAPIGLVAWVRGYRRHRSPVGLILGLGGLSFLVLALTVGQRLLEGRGEPVLTVCGSVAMIAAHQWNHRQCRCAACQPVND